MKNLKILFLFSIAFCLILTTNAQPPIPDPAKRWVIDDANVIDSGTESTISSLAQSEFDSTSNQVVVYTFSSLEGSTIEAYANEVYNTWHLGTKENSNGVLLIVAINDHKVRIEVGYGLEGTLTDLESQDIIQHVMVPAFKEGNYNDGILNGYQAILAAIKGSYTAEKKATNPFRNGYWAYGLIFILTLFGGASKGCTSYILLLISSGLGYFVGDSFGGPAIGIIGIVVVVILFFVFKAMFSGKGGSGRSSTGGFWYGGGRWWWRFQLRRIWWFLRWRWI